MNGKNGNLFRSIMFAAALSPLAVYIASAGVWHWSGFGSTDSWTDPNNWTERESYPGAVAGNEDTAVFGPVAANSHTNVSIDGMAGIKTIRFSGAATPAYTFITRDSNVLFLESGASISMEADVVNRQTFMCPLDFGIVPTQNVPSLYLTNNSASAEMVFNGYACSKIRRAELTERKDNMPYLNLCGDGSFSLLGGGDEYCIQRVNFNHKGDTYIGGATVNNRWRPKDWSVNHTGSDAFSRIVIPAGCEGFGVADGGGDGKKTLLSVIGNTVIEGAGALPQVARIDTVGYPYMFWVYKSTLKIDVPLGGCEKSGARFSNAMGFGKPTYDWRRLGGGVVELTSSNTYSGATMLVGLDTEGGLITVKAAKFGAKNCAATESNLGIGTWIAFVGTGGTLVNTGVGETCDRDIVLMPHHNGVGGTVATIRNGGTGALVLTGDVSAEGEGDAFVLDGGASGITFGGTASGDNGMTLELANAVTLNTLPEKFTAVKMSGANVTLGNSVSNIPAITIAGGSCSIAVPDNAELAIGSVAKASGVSGFINIRLGNGAHIKVTDFAGGCPDYLTVNGKPATFDSEGNLVIDQVVWSAAVNGSWNEDDKWTPNGVPGDGATVSVSATGESYEVTVPADVEIAPSYLEVMNGQDGETATVRFKGAVSFADKAMDVGAGGRIVAENGIDFTHSTDGVKRYVSEKGGTLRVTSGSLKLPPSKGDFFLNGGTVEVVGQDATLAVPTNYTFVTGDWRVEGNAGVTMDVSGSGPYAAVAPDGPGETARMSVSVVSDSSLKNRQFANLCLYSAYPGGRAVLDCLSDDLSNELKYFPSGKPDLISVGYLSGDAELNISNGYFTTGNWGLSVGTCRRGVSKHLFDPFLESPYAVTGTVNMAAGKLEAKGWSFDNYPGLCGGIILGDAQQWESDLNHCCGVMNVSGGLVKGIGPAYILLGFGRGTEGRLVQTGGEISWDCGAIYDGGASTYRARVCVGAFGGTGTWVVSNGTATVKNRFFVGGAVTNEFERHPGNGGYGLLFFRSPPLAFGGGAVGSMVVAGGTTTIESGLVVGSDGVGTVELAPAWQDAAGNIVTGRLVVSDMVLSNQTASTLKFDLSDLGIAMLSVTNSLTFAPGAELVVDATRLNANSARGWRKLMSVGSFAGDVPAPEFIVTDASRRLYENGLYLFERNGEKGLWVHAAPRGMVITLR